MIILLILDVHTYAMHIYCHLLLKKCIIFSLFTHNLSLFAFSFLSIIVFFTIRNIKEEGRGRGKYKYRRGTYKILNCPKTSLCVLGTPF